MEPSKRITQGLLFRYAIQGAVLGVLASVGVFLYTHSDQTITHLHEFRWKLAFLMFGMIFTAWLCNGCRIFLLSRSLGYPLTYRQSIATSLSCEFGIAATPAGMGGAAIRLGLLRRAGVPLAHGTSMLATDIAIDSVFFLLLSPFAISSILKNQKVLALFSHIQTEKIFFLLAGIPLIIIFFIWIGKKGFFHWCYRKVAEHPFGHRHKIQSRVQLISHKFQSEFHRMKGGITHLFQLRKGILLCTFLLSSIQWICRYSILPVILFGFSIHNDPVLLFLLQGILFTVSLIIVLPGGGGGIEVITALVLKLIIPDALVGIVILLWRFFTYHLYLLGGGSMFFYTCWHMNTLFPQLQSTDDEDINFGETQEEK
jgi:glycosyltransferase 2 family protein